MTVTHLFFAVVTTAYILVAIKFEERAHPKYASYRQQVPMIVPGMPRNVEIAEPARAARAARVSRH